MDHQEGSEGAWPAEKVDAFRKWVEGGQAA
jgi:hypothetical protein